MGGNALSIALALSRTPSLRMSLRQGPLPDDVGEVIELAAGSRDRAAFAAAGIGETPGQVIEAARFYVREILLFTGADAYRVLGVARTASAEQIKQHHRLLQHWLHPDRRGNDWEAAFATRINAAWNELRSPERRAAYDARHAQTGVATELAVAPHRVLVNRWRASSAQGSRLGWLVVIAGVAGCVWLAVLVDRQIRAPAPEWNPARGDVAHPASPSPVGALDAAIDDTAALLQPAPVDEPAQPGIDPPTETYAIDVSLAETVRAAPLPAAPVPPIPTPAQPQVLHSAWVEDAGTDRDPEQDRVLVAAATAVPDPPTPAPAEPVQAAPAEAVTPERVRLANNCGQQLTRYLTARSGHVPPIWRSAAAQDVAASIRERLAAGRVRAGEPDWRIAGDHANMAVTLQRAGEPVILRADLVWREGMWLVERLHAENLP